MILVNNTSSSSKWTIRSNDGQLNGQINPGRFQRVDNPPGNPPYGVTFTCAGVIDVSSKDAIVTFDTGKARASYLETLAASESAEAGGE